MRLFNKLYVNAYWVTGMLFGLEFDRELTEVTINLGIFKLFFNWAKHNQAYPCRDMFEY